PSGHIDPATSGSFQPRASLAHWRAGQGGTRVDQFRIDLRLLGRRPGLTVGHLLTVTLVVTAASAVCAVASATYLRPVPFPDADRLVRLNLQPPGHPEARAANPL